MQEELKDKNTRLEKEIDEIRDTVRPCRLELHAGHHLTHFAYVDNRRR